MAETPIKERPILFSGEMVRAILEGRKTQTRRIIKHQSRPLDAFAFYEVDGDEIRTESGKELKCPHGKSGDRLWVRETWKVSERNGNQYLEFKAGGFREFPRGIKEQEVSLKFKPSIHMPRWASRISLEICSIRVERLQEISDSDALAEGVNGQPGEWCAGVVNRQIGALPADPAGSAPGEWRNSFAFHVLWDKINGKRAPWASNPWVWVVEFNRGVR